MFLATRGLFKFSTRKLFIGANWKSNNTKIQTEELLNKVFNKLSDSLKNVIKGTETALKSFFRPKERDLSSEPKKELTEPKLGDKKKLLDLATANAEFMLREYFITIAKKDQLLSKSVLALQKDLHLPKPPIRIECFDNSHLQGTDYVSSMVCFVEGKPKKS